MMKKEWILILPSLTVNDNIGRANKTKGQGQKQICTLSTATASATFSSDSDDSQATVESMGVKLRTGDVGMVK